MINPKEKAVELVENFLKTRLTIYTKMDSIPTKLSDYPDKETAKKCALICVDEIIEEHTWKNPITWNKVRKKCWEQVKSEIKNL